MADVIAILSSSRAYEFPPDRIPLTLVTQPIVGSTIQQHFQFQVGGVGVPVSTFGPVPQTSALGAIFQLGVLMDDKGPGQHIREVYFEPRRVVITVAGPSAVIDQVWAQLKEVLDRFATPDGVRVLGEPSNVREFSELSVRLRIAAKEVVAPGLVNAAEEAAGVLHSNQKQVFVPAIHAILLAEDAEYPGDYPGGSIGPRNVWTLSLRSGTVIGQEREFYSAAPLDSDTHLAYLEKVEATLSASVT